MKCLTIFHRAQAGLFMKHLAKRTAVFITHLPGNFIKRKCPAFKQKNAGLMTGPTLISTAATAPVAAAAVRLPAVKS